MVSVIFSSLLDKYSNIASKNECQHVASQQNGTVQISIKSAAQLGQYVFGLCGVVMVYADNIIAYAMTEVK